VGEKDRSNKAGHISGFKIFVISLSTVLWLPVATTAIYPDLPNLLDIISISQLKIFREMTYLSGLK
jgi:hypothetical protein